MVPDHGICDHDLREKMEILKLLFPLSIIIISIMKPLGILQVTAGKATFKE